MTEEFQRRLVTQTEGIDKLSESVMESQKSVKDTGETMQTILVGMENLGENFKQLQESLDYLQTPGNPEADLANQQLNKELLRKVSLWVPATSGPMEIEVNPGPSHHQVAAQPFSVPPAVKFSRKHNI